MVHALEQVHQALRGVLLRAAREMRLSQHLLYQSHETCVDCGPRRVIQSTHAQELPQAVAHEAGTWPLSREVDAKGNAVEEALNNRIDVAGVA